MHRSGFKSRTVLLSVLMVLFFILSGRLYSQQEDLSKLPEIFRQHVAILSDDSMDGRGLGTAGREKAAAWIAGQFREIGLEPYDDQGYFQPFDLRMDIVNLTGKNVVGFLTGSDPVLRNEYILIGAHYDHLGFRKSGDNRVVFHGADDNASGVAMVIELSRWFARNPELSKRSLVFVAFDAEESGLAGSQKFIELNTRFRISALKAMFSLDMVGMLSANNGLGMKGIGSLRQGESLARAVAESMMLTLKSTSAEIEFATDTQPFGQKGVPSIHIFTGKNSPYHKPEDTYEKLDYEGMATVSEFMRGLLTRLSAEPELTANQLLSAQAKPAGFRFRVGVCAGAGSSHLNYPDEFYKAKGRFAFQGGMYAQFRFRSGFSIQPEIQYMTDGSRTDLGNLRRHTVSIPAAVQYAIFRDPYGVARVYPFAGAYYSYTFAGASNGEKMDFDTLYRRHEWGGLAGLGADIDRFQISFTWQFGLTGLMQQEPPAMIPKRWFITIGYGF